jgi:F-type H+-transporting ATPase subunit delta
LKDVTVAGRYARALFIITEKRKETARALEDLKGVQALLAPGTPAGQFLASPEVRLPDKRKSLERAFDQRVLRTVAVFVDLLMRKKRLAELGVITEEFEALVERAQGVQRAQVVSAVPLTPQELERLHAELERHTHAHIKLTAEIDSRLLGGALVKIGDRVIDRSVRSLLDAISRQLSEVSV